MNGLEHFQKKKKKKKKKEELRSLNSQHKPWSENQRPSTAALEVLLISSCHRANTAENQTPNVIVGIAKL